MLYFAILLVVIGVLCLIYVSFQQGPVQSPVKPGLKDSLFNVKYPEKHTDQYDERIRTERQFIVAEKPEEIDEPPQIVDSVEEPAGEKAEHFEVEFTIEGTLYLDRGRKIPFADSKLKQKMLVDELAGLTRESHGIMTEDRGVFHFRTGNSVHSYTVNELEQIVFFDQGFVLIPFDSSLAAPLFLTESVSDLKDFLTVKKKDYLPST